jgi:hypothetical protein
MGGRLFSGCSSNKQGSVRIERASFFERCCSCIRPSGGFIRSVACCSSRYEYSHSDCRHIYKEHEIVNLMEDPVVERKSSDAVQDAVRYRLQIDEKAKETERLLAQVSKKELR